MPPKQRLQTKSENSPKKAEGQDKNLPGYLSETTIFWPELPEHIEAAVTALIQTYNPEKKSCCIGYSEDNVGPITLTLGHVLIR